MVVVMKGLVVSGGPHRDALFVNGILGLGSQQKSRGGGEGLQTNRGRSKRKRG